MVQIPDGQNEADKKIVLAKKQLEILMIQFHEFMRDKKLPENKSNGEIKAEIDFGLRLLSAANELDVAKYPEPEGTFALLSILINNSLVMRNNNNKQSYALKQLKNEVDGLKRQIGDLTRVQQRNT